MTTGMEVMVNAYADAIREAWQGFRAHAVTCEACGRLYWRVLKDPGGTGLNRHAEYSQTCGEVGANLWGAWCVAVSQLVDHLQRGEQSQRVLA